VAELLETTTTGIETKVMDASVPNGNSGISVTVFQGRLLIAITRSGEGLCVALPIEPAHEFFNIVGDKFLLLAAGTAPTETRQ